MMTPQPLTEVVCSECKQLWRDHLISAQYRLEYEEAQDREATDNDVTLQECIKVLLKRFQGPMGPPGPVGPMGMSAR
jgi:hypothetical protein